MWYIHMTISMKKTVVQQSQFHWEVVIKLRGLSNGFWMVKSNLWSTTKRFISKGSGKTPRLEIDSLLSSLSIGFSSCFPSDFGKNLFLTSKNVMDGLWFAPSRAFSEAVSKQWYARLTTTTFSSVLPYLSHCSHCGNIQPGMECWCQPCECQNCALFWHGVHTHWVHLNSKVLLSTNLWICSCKWGNKRRTESITTESEPRSACHHLRTPFFSSTGRLNGYWCHVYALNSPRNCTLNVPAQFFHVVNAFFSPNLISLLATSTRNWATLLNVSMWQIPAYCDEAFRVVSGSDLNKSDLRYAVPYLWVGQCTSSYTEDPRLARIEICCCQVDLIR
jgi:hypothetical protein